jgi:hypothetical protein
MSGARNWSLVGVSMIATQALPHPFESISRPNCGNRATIQPARHGIATGRCMTRKCGKMAVSIADDRR